MKGSQHDSRQWIRPITENAIPALKDLIELVNQGRCSQHVGVVVGSDMRAME